MFLPPKVKPALRIRLVTVVSVFALLLQIVFVGPVRKADAKAKPPVLDTSSPAEPFIVNTPPRFAATVISGVSSFLGLVTPSSAKKEPPKTDNPAVEPPSPARAQPAPFMSSATPAEFAALRLMPGNATGGTDLYSRNFGWGTSLVGLPGRAGLDAGFGISYNSLVWIKDTTNSEIIFDPELSNVSPGFKMGFPDIEQIYNTGGSNYSFLMVNPDGSRTEFRRVGTTNTFESGDSTYRELKINTGGVTSKASAIDITVTSTDGTAMHYIWKRYVGRYQCEEIKDRNGNYINIDYDSSTHRMTALTDTLGRTIIINYDGGGYPTTITQAWKATNGEGTTTTHTWATLSYTNVTVSTSFSGLTVVGPANSTTVKALEKITYPDGSFTKFEYNGYIQVKKISQVAADSTSHILNYVSTNLDAVSGTQTDCPRLTTTRSWVENFNLSGGTPQEVVVTNSLTTGATYSLPNSITGSATRIDVAMTGHPDGLYSRTYVGASGYKERLPLATEDCTGSGCATRLRWTWTDWTQDNTGVSYITNPRVVESRVGDGTNVKKTTIGYGSNGFGLPEEVKVYDTDLSTVLKTQTTSYQLGSTYTDRRIIGLPLVTALYGGTVTTPNLVSKMTYAYDGGNMTDTDPVQNISPTQHDNTNYSSSFVTGRGLLTSVTRCDASTSTTTACNDGITSSMKYNTAGAVVSKTDPLSHTVKIAYADNFNTTGNPTTYAYPTTITDQAGNSSTIKYRYDIGANIVATSPAPAGQTYGKTSIRTFDSIGRLGRQSIYVNNTEKAYTRYEYPTNGMQSQSYTPVIDADGDNNIAEDEVYSESWFDGAGRVRRSRTEHPGSTGGWTATQTEYDILGRTYRTSVPTEVSVSGTTWTAAGDDSTRGWIWNYQEYDWKGRVKRTIPSDSNGSDGKDTLISYAGCGCAGGQVTTIEGPSVPRTDTSGDARRKQKVYEDILGRNFKTESFEWDESTVYSTTINTYNGRDQVTQIRQYSGNTSSSTYQDTTFTFDGHGRLASRHVPEQGSNKNTTYTYLTNDQYETATDGRGAVTHYDYNNRGLIEELSYTVPYNSGIAVPQAVTFSYDNVGNVTEMADGLGTLAYSYNSLSQVVAETREFNETVPASPNNDNTFTIEYSYALNGQVRTVTEPFGETITYGMGKTGLLDTVGSDRIHQGSPLAFVTNADYRAWGAPKRIDYGTDRYASVDYNNRLQADEYDLYEPLVYNNQQIVRQIRKQYDYFNDGKLKTSDIEDIWPYVTVELPNFDRLYQYDFKGRIIAGKTGTEARGQTENNPVNRPYRHEYTYNAFDNHLQTQRKHWQANLSLTEQFQNNRTTGISEQRDSVPCGPGCDNGTYADFENMYDDDGRPTNYLGDGHEFDAAGQKIKRTEWVDNNEHRYTRDGNGRILKEVNAETSTPAGWNLQKITCAYFEVNLSGTQAIPCTRNEFTIYSSVLNAEIGTVGNVVVWPGTQQASITQSRIRLKVVAGNDEIAERQRTWLGAYSGTAPYDWTYLEMKDPAGENQINLNLVSYNPLGGVGIHHLDPFGAIVGDTAPYFSEGGEPGENCQWVEDDPGVEPGYWDCDEISTPDDEDNGQGSVTENTCYVDGFEANCNEALHNVDKDTAVTKEDQFPDNAPSSEGSQGIWDSESEVKAETTSQSETYGLDDNGMPTTEIVQTNQYSIAVGTISDIDLRTQTMPNPEPTPPPDPDINKPIGEVQLENKLKGKWGHSPEARKRLNDCLRAATDAYMKQVDDLNMSAFNGWRNNSLSYLAGSFAIPAGTGIHSTLTTPGASFEYGWKQQVRVDGKAINPKVMPGNRGFFWAGFITATASYIYSQNDANETSAILFGAHSKNYFLERNNCIKANKYDVFEVEQ